MRWLNSEYGRESPSVRFNDSFSGHPTQGDDQAASAKTTSPKNGNAQIISLPPLQKGGISMSDRKTRTSVPSATIAVIKEKYVK